MSSEVADLGSGDEETSRIKNDVFSARAKDATISTQLEEEQQEEETLGADAHAANSASPEGGGDAQFPLTKGGSGLDGENNDEENSGHEPASPASRLRRLALDNTSSNSPFSLRQDILIKLALLPCAMGLRDAMTRNLEPERMKLMRQSSRIAVQLALRCNAPNVTVARCHFYQALVNMSIGMGTGDSEGESPVFLLDQVKNVEDCIERECAMKWLSKLQGQETSTPQKTENRRSLVERAYSYGISFLPNLSPYKANSVKAGPQTQHDSMPEMLKRMVDTPTKTKPPNISRQSPSTQAPDSARPVMSPVTPTKQRNRTSETPGSRASQVSRQLSDLYEWSPRSGERGENLDNLSMSDWQSRPNSRFSMNSNISASPNTPSKTKEGSPRRPYPLRHRSSGVDGDGSPKSSPTAKSTLRFSYPGEKSHNEDDEEEDILPAPNTSRRKHNRSRSLALNLTSPSKQQSKNDDNAFGDWSSPSSRRKTSIVGRLGFGRAKTEAFDPHDEAERGSPRRATFAATQEEMEDLMEKGDSPRMMEFAGGDKRGSVGETR